MWGGGVGDPINFNSISEVEYAIPFFLNYHNQVLKLNMRYLFLRIIWSIIKKICPPQYLSIPPTFNVRYLFLLRRSQIT